jgi:N-methylhydantoinase A/oxoprolinase/acetone carboxylase beta subunit|tara:strand:- start:2192 stop:3733 length:1542 start_codon:yes stop_codon:yes gene_type:complete
VRIGIDVGGTNTDAVVMDGVNVVATTKTPTTENITDGIVSALRTVVKSSNLDVESIDGVMIGTTHFTNAMVERRRLEPTACIRLGLPATVCLPPLVDWPDDLAQVLGNHTYLAHGGHEFDGREISAFDADEVRNIAENIQSKGINAIAISSVFSPVNSEFESKTSEIVRETLPDANITLSSTIGRIGLLERENAAVMNACLRKLAVATVSGFKEALSEMNISAPFFISQNDGTLMNADFAAEYPVLTFASGPTNSMRGAAFLSNLKDAIVVDVGGTTTDVGVLQQGFPRVAATAVSIGGVRTNFRMPDTLSIGLGGGSIIQENPIKVGPQSVGFELTQKAQVFGGSVLTATDIAVAGGLASVGNQDYVSNIDSPLIERVTKEFQEMVSVAVDRMKTSASLVPAVIVGGGSILIQDEIEGTSEILKPNHYSVANAIGAAIAQVGGETDRVFSLAEMSRDEALAEAKTEATDRAASAGAQADTIEIVDVEEVPLAYLPGNATRIMVKAVGDLAGD